MTLVSAACAASAEASALIPARLAATDFRWPWVCAATWLTVALEILAPWVRRTAPPKRNMSILSLFSNIGAWCGTLGEIIISEIIIHFPPLAFKLSELLFTATLLLGMKTVIRYKSCH